MSVHSVLRRLAPLGLLATLACADDLPVTIRYAHTVDYPPGRLAIRLGDQRISGDSFYPVPPGPVVDYLTTIGAGSALPLEVTLTSGTTTLAAVIGQVDVLAGHRLTIHISAGPPSGSSAPCGVELAPVVILGGAPSDRLAVRWFATPINDLVGPC